MIATRYRIWKKLFILRNAMRLYWQVRVKKEDRDKMHFVCALGTFKFFRMSFVLNNADSIFFQHLVVKKRVRKTAYSIQHDSGL